MTNLMYNKRGIMEYAHRMWTAEPTPFGEKLHRAWELAKVYMRNGKATGQFVYHKPTGKIMTFEEGILEYYKNLPSGAYTGD